MAYWDTGIGEAVLLLHGFPFDKSMWEPQISFLANNGFRAVVPDFPGFGETSWSGETSTMDEMARCCAELLDKLKIERAVICGLSMGSYVTFELAHLFPKRVSAMVLAGARAEGPDETEKASREQQAKRALAEGMNFAIDSILNNLLAPGTLANKPAVVSHVRKMIEATNAGAAAAAQRGMAIRRDYASDLPNIHVPTLIIAGREDRVRKPADAESIHRGIKGSRLQIIEEAGHLMNMERPQAFNSALFNFLELIH